MRSGGVALMARDRHFGHFRVSWDLRWVGSGMDVRTQHPHAAGDRPRADDGDDARHDAGLKLRRRPPFDTIGRFKRYVA